MKKQLQRFSRKASERFQKISQVFSEIWLKIKCIFLRKKPFLYLDVNADPNREFFEFSRLLGFRLHLSYDIFTSFNLKTDRPLSKMPDSLNSMKQSDICIFVVSENCELEPVVKRMRLARLLKKKILLFSLRDKRYMEFFMNRKTHERRTFEKFTKQQVSQSAILVSNFVEEFY